MAAHPRNEDLDWQFDALLHDGEISKAKPDDLDEACMAFLVRNAAWVPPDEVDSDHGRLQPLRDTAAAGLRRTVAELLSRRDWPKDQLVWAGQLAAADGHVEIVDRLLSAGLDVNDVDERKQTMLHMAIGSYRARTNLPVLKLLLARGADPLMVAAGAGFSAREN